MLVRVGPVASGSVTMWVAYARTVLAQATARPGEHGIAPELIEGFEQYLDEWDTAATGTHEVIWEVDLDPEQVRYLAHAFHRLALGLAEEAERRGYPISPPEGDEFYRCLVNGFLDALELESEPMREFAEELRTTWPGIKDD
ncbi:MAG: hypothetical protein R2726_01250 [Acidimicrobiales bacterium]